MITVVLAACQGGGAECQSDRDCDPGMRCVAGSCRFSAEERESGSSTSTSFGGVSIEVNAPESIFAEEGGEEEFSLTISSESGLRKPVLIISNFGPYLTSSSCEGSISLAEITAGESREVDCDVRVKAVPSSSRSQEIEYELDWTGDLDVSIDGVEILSEERFELEDPSQSDAEASADYGPAELSFTIEDVPAKTGSRVSATMRIEADSSPSSGVRCIEAEGGCSHHIEEVRIKVPSGFQVMGLSGFSTTRCGEGYTCFVENKVKLSADGEFEEEFSLILPRFAADVKKQTFLFEAYATGIRFYEVDSFELDLEAAEE